MPAAFTIRFHPATAGLAIQILLTTPLQAQRTPEDGTAAWDVTMARGTPRDIDFVTREGTWMSLDVSPDGRWILFDLLGQIYRVPVGGGDATPLTASSGIAIDQQPRYSPDGHAIAFISDRNGQDNLWLMEADGSDPRPVFTSLDLRAVEPAWMPDGRFIVVRQRSARAGVFPFGLTMYHKTGGRGIDLLPPAVRMPGSPSVTGDGRYLYFHRFEGQLQPFGHVDALKGDWQLYRLELASGDVAAVTVGRHDDQQRHNTGGGGFGPEVSPDGRWLAFGRPLPEATMIYRGHQYGPRTALWLRDLETGTERVLLDRIEQDMSAEITHSMPVIPRYKWFPDGGSLVVAQAGGIRRVHLNGRVDTIAFTARVRRSISAMARGTVAIRDGALQVGFLRWPATSPDGRRLAFEAAGRIWLMDLPAGQPRRLTPPGFKPIEQAAAWSPDGATIAFTTWDDEESGHLWRIPATGGEPVRVSPSPGEYLNPVWPDALHVMVTRGAGSTARGEPMGANPWFSLVRFPVTGGAPATITRIAARATNGRSVQANVGPEGRVYFMEPDSTGGDQLLSIARSGGDRRVHARFDMVTQVAIAPGGEWVAYESGGDIYLAPLTRWRLGAGAVRYSRDPGPTPIRRLSTGGGLFPRWRDSATVEFVSGNRYFAHRTSTNATDTVSIRLDVPRDIPTGTMALTNARIITLDSAGVIGRGTVVATNGRITCVGRCQTGGASRVIDLRGRTIVPGWIDTHAHHHWRNAGIIPRRSSDLAAYLAYGVTTTLDPFAISTSVFPAAAMIETGEVIGPRLLSTGEAMDAFGDETAGALASLAAVELEVARRVAWGATIIKPYTSTNRLQRQWAAEEARRRGLQMTAEGSFDLAHKLSMAMDGFTGFEHATPAVPLYSDVTGFLGRAGVTYAGTLVVAGPGPWAEEYFFQQNDLWKDEKLRRWTPWRELHPHTRRRVLRPATDYPFPIMAEAVKDILGAGGHSAIGSHGQQHGLSSHWEMWILAEALPPLKVLELASMGGARFAGIDRDVGSITVGKVADLVVLNRNPLEDIRATTDIAYVMKAGRLRDGISLDEIWPRARPFGLPYWMNSPLGAGSRKQ